MREGPPCTGTRTDGTPCQSVLIVDPDAHRCSAHPVEGNGREIMSERGRLGGRTRMPGLEEGELPPLDSHANAERWLDIVGRALVTRRIQHSEASALSRLVDTFQRVHSDRQTADKFQALQAEHKRLLRRLDEAERRTGRLKLERAGA